MVFGRVSIILGNFIMVGARGFVWGSPGYQVFVQTSEMGVTKRTEARLLRFTYEVVALFG